MRITSSPLNLPMALIAAASLLGAIYTTTPAHARDLVGTQLVAKAQPPRDSGASINPAKRPGTRVTRSQATDMNEAVASSMLTSHGDGTEAARRAEFARRLFWVMLSMR
jgi:hypothetical protein